MRKIYSFAVAAVAMFAAMSCAKEIVQDNQQAGMPDNDALTFVASVDGADDASETKSVLDGLKSYWDGEEKIWILDPRNETNDEGPFLNTGWKKGFTAVTEKSQTATFVEDDNTTSFEGETLMAVYPAGPAGSACWEGGESSVTGMWLSNEQTAVAGSYDPTAHIAIARASKSSNLLEFKNVSSLLKFQVAENIKGEVKFISYEPTAGEAPRISGNFSVDYNDGEPVVTPESGENKITFDAVALKGEFAVDNDYYMAILPAKLEAGFAVQINGYTVKELKDSRSLTDEKFASLLDRKRNMILNLGTVSLNFGVCGTHTDWESDTPMSYDEASGLYVAQDVTFDKENNAFKIRSNGLWATSVGTGGAIAVDSRNQAYMDGGNSMIAAGTYDIWFDADRKIIYAMSDGNTPADLKFASMVYLKPAAGWSSDDAKFAAYFFGDAVEPIAIMIQDSDSDDIYEAAVPKGDYNQLLFVRLSSDTDSFDWNRTLHQTFDLETPMSDNDKLCYVITTMPDSHKYSEGIWQTLEEAKYVAPEFVAQEGYIYLQPSSEWLADNARFAAYFFNETWADMTLVEGQKDIYQCPIPEGEINVIFCRMNPSATENSWTNKWNQTGDLKMTDGSLYIVSGWEEGSWTGDPAVTEPEPEPEPVVLEWGIVGLNGDWVNNVEMTLVDGWYVAENVTIKTTDGFKFRVGTTWDKVVTYTASVIAADTEYETIDGQGTDNEMKVAVSAIYSVYLSLDATTMKVVKTAELPVESVPDQPSDWALAGTFNSWADAAMVTTTVPDLFVVKNVALDAYAELKVKKKASGADNGWGTSYGSASVNYLNKNIWISVASGGANVSVVNSGKYDVYFDLTNKKLYLMASGVAYDSATEQTTNGAAPVIIDGKVIYLDTNIWGTNANYTAWVWGESDKWVTFEPTDEAGIYSAVVPKGTTHMIFLRKDPNHSLTSWDCWNRTGNETIGSNNCFRVTDWNGHKDNGSYSKGTWSKR